MALWSWFIPLSTLYAGIMVDLIVNKMCPSLDFSHIYVQCTSFFFLPSKEKCTYLALNSYVFVSTFLKSQ